MEGEVGDEVWTDFAPRARKIVLCDCCDQNVACYFCMSGLRQSMVVCALCRPMCQDPDVISCSVNRGSFDRQKAPYEALTLDQMLGDVPMIRDTDGWPIMPWAEDAAFRSKDDEADDDLA